MRHLFLSFIVLGSLVGSLGNSAWAGDIEWTGEYRIEGVKIENADISALGKNTQYILHHLILSPKITAYDGFTINGKFDIMNNAKYPNSQLGQFFGNGVGTPGGTTSDNNNILSDHQQSEMLAVSQLYLTYAHEFGVLTVGRAPLQFGLGMSYNAGNGAFDHWYDTRDMVAYKFTMGNMTFMPVIAKVVEDDIGFEDDIDDYMFMAQYENPDTELKMGIMYRRRHAARHGNDVPGAPVFGDGTSTSPQGLSGFKGEYWNLFFQRYIGSSFKFGMEVGTSKGSTGVVAAASPVDIDGYGLAVEMDWLPKDQKFNFGLKTGLASGDNAKTVNSYEGYVFDRNYDVAFLLFNHPMGQYDVFRTAANRKTTPANPQEMPASRADEEAISNVFYFAPTFTYKWTEKFNSQLGLTYAQLNSDPLSAVSVDKGVGFEVDITLNYKPYENIQWVNRVGIFSPGAAFKGGGAFETNTVYGLETKAAISF